MSQEMKEMNNQVEEVNSTELNEEDLEAVAGGGFWSSVTWGVDKVKDAGKDFVSSVETFNYDTII